jgi:hypothetical protein
MDTKKPLYHLLIRIGILILLIIGVFIYSKFTYESNRSNGELGAAVGFSVITLFLGQAYCLFLLIEMIYFFSKKNRNLALTNLTFLIIIELIPILVLLYLI